MKKVAVLQSNYLPWKGYFDIIHDVDLFIFYDEVQFTKNDWRNRNKVMAGGTAQWMTVPTGSHIHQRIVDVKISNRYWQKKHFQTLQTNYRRAPYYKKYIEFFYESLIEKEWIYLFELNRYFIERISRDFLGIQTEFADSRNYISEGSKGEKLLSLLKAARANVYISGPAAKDYLSVQDYERAGIQVVWKDYSGYPAYPQFSKRFSHYVSIADMLFQVGDQAPRYIWGWRNARG